MSAVATQPRLTPEQYLDLERKAMIKSEYLSGHIYAMAGASREHNLITGNIFGELRFQLREKPCETYVNDMRVKVSSTGLYTYPDVAVVCDEPRFEDTHLDTLLNPTVLVEVLSPSTEAYDRGDKFAHYRRLESLQEYVLAAQDRVRVEHYLRQGEQWLLTELSDLDDVLHLTSIDCALPLREIYAKVEFPANEAPQMEKPYKTVQRDSYKLTIYHGITPLDLDNDNVDVKVTFPNGESFSAVFFTLPNINTLMQGYKKTGECAGGLYFWAADMIIVERLTEKTICETIDNLLADEEFGYIFSRDEALEDISPKEEDKLFKCFEESLNEP